MVQFRVDVVVDPTRAVRGVRGVERGLTRLQRRSDALRTSFASTFAFIGVAAGIRQLVRYADTFTDVQNRLKLVTDGTGELVAVTDELFEIADRSRNGFEATAQLYARTALAARDLGRSQEELLGFTESVTQAIILSGASAIESRNALIQLSQGIASNRLSGDELRSVLEQLPAVADVIAESLGITRGELRGVAKQGVITAKVILDAFKAARGELADKFAKTVPTVAQSFTILTNNVIRFVAQMDTANGISRRLSKTLLFIAENMDVFARSTIAAGTALSVIFVEKGVLRAIKALKLLSILILTNPIVLLATALAVGIAAFVAFGDQILAANNGIATLQDVMVVAFKAISEVFAPVIAEMKKFFGTLDDAGIDIRIVVEAIATAFDQILGAARGFAFAMKAVFADRLPIIFEFLENQVEAVGLRLRITFEKIVNDIATLFTNPFALILKQAQSIITAVGGVAAVAAAFGAISEETRVKVEDAVAGVEKTVESLSKKNKPVNLFDTDETQRRLDELGTQAEGQLKSIGSALTFAFKEGFNQDTLLGFVKSIFNQAEEQAEANAAALAAKAREVGNVDLSSIGEDRSVENLTKAQQRIVRMNDSLLRTVQIEKEINAQQEQLNKRADLLRVVFAKIQPALKGDVLIEQSQAFEVALAEIGQASDILALKLAKLQLEPTVTQQFEDLRVKMLELEFAPTLEQRLEDIRIRGLEASTALGDGFTLAFLKIKQEAEDLGAVSEAVFGALVDNLTNTLTKAVRTGEFTWSEFTNSILDDITKIIVRLLVVQSLSALGGAAGLGGGGGLLGGALTGARAEGGPVQPGQRMLVGEKGPEVVQFGRTATVFPNQSNQQQAPAPKITVINQIDPDDFSSAIASGALDSVIINVLPRNRDKVRQVVS